MKWEEMRGNREHERGRKKDRRGRDGEQGGTRAGRYKREQRKWKAGGCREDSIY